jgi:hypothetical protein
VAHHKINRLFRRQLIGEIRDPDNRFCDSRIQFRQVILRLSRFWSPGMHRIVGRVNIQATDTARRLESVDVGRQHLSALSMYS